MTIRHSALVLAVMLLVAGCNPPGAPGGDDQARQYFLAGKALVDKRDFPGAAQRFQQALGVNPAMAEAHYELGLLYLGQWREDDIKALYHFDRVLELNPDHSMAGLIASRMEDCRLRLGGGIIPGTATATLEQQYQQVQARLRNEQAMREQLETRVAELTAQLTEARSRFSAADTSTAVLPADSRREPPAERTDVSAPALTPTPAASASGFVSYQIRQGDTLYSLGRRHGVSVAEIQRANPGLNPNSLAVGQTIRIPSR